MTIAATAAEIDKLRGDLEATAWLLADAEERLAASQRLLEQAIAERDEIRATLAWKAQS